jgi:hypothetical protein
MEAGQARTAGRAKAAIKSAPAAIALGKPATLAGVAQVKKGETQQLKLSRSI